MDQDILTECLADLKYALNIIISSPIRTCYNIFAYIMSTRRDLKYLGLLCGPVVKLLKSIKYYKHLIVIINILISLINDNYIDLKKPILSFFFNWKIIDIKRFV